METVKGNLISLALFGKYNIIIHGCNCFCTMGAGFARQIKETFPEAYEADCQTLKGDRDKLGYFSTALIERNTHHIVVVNAYTQFNYGKPPKVYVQYAATRDCFRNLASYISSDETLKKFLNNKIKIAYPLIGCGLAGGRWKEIENIINSELKGFDHTLVTL